MADSKMTLVIGDLVSDSSDLKTGDLMAMKTTSVPSTSPRSPASKRSPSPTAQEPKVNVAQSKSTAGVTLAVALNALNNHEKESIKRVEAIYQQHLEQLLEWKRHQVTHIHTTFQQYRQSFFGESLPQPNWTPTPLILPNASSGTSSTGTNALHSARETPTIILTSKSGSVSESEEPRPPPLEADSILQPMDSNTISSTRPSRRKRRFEQSPSAADNQQMSAIVRAVKKRRLEQSCSLSVLALSSDSDSNSKCNSVGPDAHSKPPRRVVSSPATAISISSSTSPVLDRRAPNYNRKTKGVELLLAAADHFEAVRRSKSNSAFGSSNALVFTNSHDASRAQTPSSNTSRSDSVHRRGSVPHLETVLRRKKRGSSNSMSPRGQSGRDDSCDKCAKVRGNMSKSNWGRHLAADHRHSCYLCSCSFTKKSYLTEHLDEVHHVSDSDFDEHTSQLITSPGMEVEV